MRGGVLTGEHGKWGLEVEGPCRHVSVVKDATDECEGGVARGEDDFVWKFEAKVVRDEDEEVREVAEGGGDLRIVVT